MRIFQLQHHDHCGVGSELACQPPRLKVVNECNLDAAKTEFEHTKVLLTSGSRVISLAHLFEAFKDRW